MSGSSSYLLGTDDVGNNHSGYETLSSNADRHSPDNTAEVGGQKVDKKILSSVQISALCATWFALGVWIYIFIVQMIPTLQVMQGSPGAYPGGPNASAPITPAEECPSASSKAGGTLGALYAYGALVSMIVAPTAGVAVGQN